MRKLYIILLIFTGLTGFAFSPPVINQPTPYQICTDDSGIGLFDLTVKVPEILGNLDPNLYTVTFHHSGTEAEMGQNPIAPINAYNNLLPFNETLFVRVIENANPTEYSLTALNLITEETVSGTILNTNGPSCVGLVTFQATGGFEPYTFLYSVDGGVEQAVSAPSGNTAAFTLPEGIHTVMLTRMISGSSNTCFDIVNGSLNIEVLAAPVIYVLNDLYVTSNEQGSHPAFDLLDVYPDIFPNGQAGMAAGFFNTLSDALSNMNPIDPMFVFAYNGSDGETVWVRVENLSTGCYRVADFRLHINNFDEVYIPDANFRNALLNSDGANQVAQDLNNNFTAVDANADGRIQYSEAENISFLNIPQLGIRDLTGLEAFVNVNWLNTGYNAQLTSIPTAALPLLRNLSSSHCNLSSLNLSNNPLLYDLSVEYNNLSSLDATNNAQLVSLHCQNNHLTQLSLTSLVNLAYLFASNNQLAILDTSNLAHILTFDVGANFLTQLDLSGMPTVQTLVCEENQINSLDTAGCTGLTTLRCAANQMTYLNVSESTALTNLDCNLNTLLDLDLSSNTALCSLNASWNQSLETVNIKNGVDTCYTNFNFWGTNPVLQQFCCDDNEAAYFKNYFLTNMQADINVSSYCSFTPGGDYNTITVNTQFDANNNGCDVNDGGYPNIRLNISDSTNQGASFTNANGGGFFYTQAGNFAITPSVEHPTWFSISPASANVQFSNTNHNTVNQNFCIAPVGVHADLEVAIAPLTSARPGFDVYYTIVVKNKGNQRALWAGNGIVFNYDASRMTFIEASTPVFSSDNGVLNWSLSNLPAFQSKIITLRMNVNPPTHPTHPVNIGDVLPFDATVHVEGTDEVPSDNQFHYNHVVIGSYDPNEIVCLEGNIVSPIEIGNYLHYTINFENTGNADAENVVVRDTINPAQFDINSLQLLGSSASVTTRISGNIAEFIFPSINLHSGGHGNILLKVRTNTTLNEGDTVSKTANIYFDYNFPVATDPENTTFQTLSNPDIPTDASISVYPNPTKGNVNISCNNNIKSVALYDVQGRLLQTSLVNENKANVDLSGNSNGVYFVKIISDRGMKVQKIVKE